MKSKDTHTQARIQTSKSNFSVCTWVLNGSLSRDQGGVLLKGCSIKHKGVPSEGNTNPLHLNRNGNTYCSLMKKQRGWVCPIISADLYCRMQEKESKDIAVAWRKSPQTLSMQKLFSPQFYLSLVFSVFHRAGESQCCFYWKQFIESWTWKDNWRNILPLPKKDTQYRAKYDLVRFLWHNNIVIKMELLTI